MADVATEPVKQDMVAVAAAPDVQMSPPTEPATPELTRAEKTAERQRVAAEKRAAKAAAAEEKRRLAAEKKAAKQAEQAEKKRKREEDKVAKAAAREAAKLRHAAEEAEAKRLAEEQRAATAHTAQENAAKLAAIRAGMQEGKWEEELKGLQLKKEEGVEGAAAAGAFQIVPKEEDVKGADAGAFQAYAPKEETVEGAAAGAHQVCAHKAEPDDALLEEEEERPKKRARAPREYMPRVGTNNEAFLITLLKYKRAGDAMPTKNELMASTEESGINNVSVYGDGESWYDGWSCFKHMRDKRDPPLVLTQGRGPMKCWLTPAGEELAIKCYQRALDDGRLDESRL